MTKSMKQEFERIAKKHLSISSLDPKGKDSLDFKEVSVVALAAALEEAYLIGSRDGYLSLASKF